MNEVVKFCASIQVFFGGRVRKLMSLPSMDGKLRPSFFFAVQETQSDLEPDKITELPSEHFFFSVANEPCRMCTMLIVSGIA